MALPSSPRLSVAYRLAEALRPSPRNPRRHPDEQLAAITRSIEAFGFVNPILADPDGEIIAGEARWRAAQARGLEELPVITLGHLTAAERDALRVADNRLPLGASWDESLLAEVLDGLATEAFDLAALGFREDELAALVNPTLAAASTELPSLPAGDRAPFQNMTFILHDTQAVIVKRAIDRAKEAGPFDGSPNENSNGNALTRICEAYLAGDAEG